MHYLYDKEVINSDGSIGYKQKYDNSDLEEYEELCKNCNGWGDIDFLGVPDLYFECVYCNGKGKIDWIDKIKKGIKNED